MKTTRSFCAALVPTEAVPIVASRESDFGPAVSVLGAAGAMAAIAKLRAHQPLSRREMMKLCTLFGGASLVLGATPRKAHAEPITLCTILVTFLTSLAAGLAVNIIMDELRGTPWRRRTYEGTILKPASTSDFQRPNAAQV